MAQRGQSKALTYAEQTLGVHAVFEAVQKHMEHLEEARHHLREYRRYKTDEEEQYTDAELNFYAQERARLADMSQAQFDKHIKVAINQEPELRRLRGGLAKRTQQIETAETDISIFRTRVEVGIARMNELGGYLAYLAAIKEAETAQKHPPATAVQSPTVEDWPPASAVAGTQAATPATPTTPATPAIPSS
jgi:hypothetical protein